MQDCKDAGMKLLDLIWVDTDKSDDPAHKNIRSIVGAREFATKNQGKIQRSSFASHLFSAMPPFEFVRALVSIMMSVGWSTEGKPLKLRFYDRSRAHFQGTAQRQHGAEKVCKMIKIMYGIHDSSHIWQSDYVTPIFAELVGKRRVKHRTALYHSSNEDVRMAVHGDDFVWLSDQSHRLTAQIKILSERHGNTWIRRLRREKTFSC